LRQNKLQPFKDFAICPHSPDEKCHCRKPSGLMIKELITKYHIDSKHSYMVGDKVIDAESGKNAGIHGILVRQMNKSDFPYFKNLLDFAHHLKSNP
jgi:HAD superfamily hydrolase (TIGR01662 family)